ncbi:MAG: triose-phosphate isomerase [Chloroflexi bacterium]|nr:MAG: triose-phosphate isomerase [Chloroflexota bacterium]MBL1196199.1 triose-phosphate isomerase [Chloroflexota bacterium]NOH13492.1 triose-phosphate isomerase [Chloroflexota bacterium]
MRTPLVAGNWKLNKTVKEAGELITALLPGLKAINGVEKLVCPPFTALMAVGAMLEDQGVALGAQNLYWEESGAYTGEISPAMVAELCQYVIIGHSERRAYFGETDESVNRRVQAALTHGLRPVVCVGETLEENEAGRAAEVVSRQVKDGLAGVTLRSADDLVVAYEPVWAIGTGKAATSADAVTIHRNVVRPTLAGLFGEDVAQGIRILYGGSVKPGNAAEYFGEEEIDGALVGGASLKAEDFVAIAQAAA